MVDLVALAIAVMAVILEVWWFVTWPRRKRVAGDVVADLGRSAHYPKNLLAGGGSAVLGLLAALQGGPKSPVFDLAGLLLVLVSPLLLVGAASRVLLTENGLLHFFRFEPWENLLGWREVEGEPGVLETRHRKRYFDPTDLRTLFVKTRQWSMDPERMSRLEEALSQVGRLPRANLRGGE